MISLTRVCCTAETLPAENPHQAGDDTKPNLGKTGFTLVELLAVTRIIGTLIGLF